MGYTIQKAVAAVASFACLSHALPTQIGSRDLNPSDPQALLSAPLFGKPVDDFNCKSDYNPIVMLHGLTLNDRVDLNQLQYKLNGLGYCTFSKTYGAHTLAPWMGGMTGMADSAADIADFIKEVHSKTGAQKVDLVGHSEGGVQTLYVPLTQPGISEIVERTIALGPAVHGAQYFGLTKLFYWGGNYTRHLAADILKVVGCEACDDMATGGRVYNDFAAAAGHIVQPGVKATVIMSTYDKLVTPNISTVDEPGVRNLVVQDYCPDDKVGHGGLAYDQGIWDLVINELKEDYNGTITCDTGVPFRY